MRILVLLSLLLSTAVFSFDQRPLCGKLLYAKVSGLEEMGFNYVLANSDPEGMLERDDVSVLLNPDSRENQRLLRNIVENWNYDTNTYPEVCIKTKDYIDLLITDGSTLRVVTDFDLN